VSEIDRPRLVLYVALGLIVCLLGARYLRGQPDGGVAAPASAVTTTSPAGDGQPPTVSVGRADGGRVTVHVAGAVRRPGIYRLAPGARVDDALRRAGGPARDADLTAINLAAKLEDGRQVLVPASVAPAGAGGAATPGSAAGAQGPTAGASPSPQGAASGPINLNTATLEQLDTLDGVGPGIARRILDYREQHGGFRRVEDLAEVAGIGDKRLAALAPLVTAG